MRILCFFVLLTIFGPSFASSDKSKALSRSISEIIEVFYVRPQLDFDFIVYGQPSHETSDILNGIMAKSSKSTFKTVIRYINDNTTLQLNQSAVILCDDVKKLIKFNSKTFLGNYFRLLKDFEISAFTGFGFWIC